MPRLLKVVVALAALGVLAFLFVRSAQSSREMPFTVEEESLAGWTFVAQPDADVLGSWLALSPPASLAPSLGREVFRRAGESVNYPNPPLLPLLLQTEFDRAFAGAVMPDEIVSLAVGWPRVGGIFPRCMGPPAYQRPGATRACKLLLFDAPAFVGSGSSSRNSWAPRVETRHVRPGGVIASHDRARSTATSAAGCRCVRIGCRLPCAVEAWEDAWMPGDAARRVA
jgi:hypothetical protein